MERAKLHHLAHGAPSGKQRNDQATHWSLQPQLASVVSLISGVAWLSSSAPLKSLTNFPYSCPSAAHFLSSTHGSCGLGGDQDPTKTYPGQGQAKESKRLCLPVPTSCSAHCKGCPMLSLLYPPPRLLSPHLGQGMESITSLC